MGLLRPTPSAEQEKALQAQQRRDAALGHTAHGTGLCEVVRGETATFFVQSNTPSGEPMHTGGLLFKVSQRTLDVADTSLYGFTASCYSGS